MDSCQWISPPHCSTSPLLSYFKARFRRTLLFSSLSLPSAALQARSLQPHVHRCFKHNSACTTLIISGGQDKLQALVTAGTTSSWLPTFFIGPLKRLTLPLTHLLSYIQRGITEEESLWDVTILWPVSACVHVK